MADVATYMPPQAQSVVQPHSLRQLSPEFQLPPMVSGAGGGHRGGNQAETEIPLVVSDPYLFEMPSGMLLQQQQQQQQSALHAAPPPQMTVFWKGEQQPTKKSASR